MIRFADVGSLGWNADMPAHDLAEQPLTWSSIRNMAFRAGLAERVQGYLAGFDTTPAAAPLGMFSAIQADGTAYVVTGTAQKILSYSGVTETDQTGSTTPAATADLKWSGGEFNSHLVITDHVGVPQFITLANLGTAQNFADLTNWPAGVTCRVLRPWKYWIFAANMTEGGVQYPYRVRWSSSVREPNTLPSSYTGTSANDSGYRELSSTYGQIVDMLPLGDILVIFRSRGITLCRWTGGTDVSQNLVMSFQDVPTGAVTGILGLNCVTDVPSLGHVTLSQNDLYIFDGTKCTSVLDKRAKDWLRETIDSTNARRAFLVNNADRSEVWVCIPESGQSACTAALIYNYADGTLGLRTLPSATCGIHAPVSEGAGSAWSGLSGTWDTLTTGSWSAFANTSKFRKTVIGADKLYVVGNALTENGTSMVSQLERTYISLGDAQMVKFVKAVWPRFEASTGQTFTISVGTSMSVDEAISWQSSQTYTYGTSRKVDVNKAGRFIAIRIRTTGDPWRLRSLDIDATTQGTY